MDPISAGTIVSLLVKYVRHVSELAGNATDEAVTGWLRGIWDAVATRFKGDQQAEGALGRLVDSPEDTRRQAAVEGHLDDLLQADHEFVLQLTKLLQNSPEQNIADVRVTNSGAAIIGDGSIEISGMIASGRDVAVDLTSPQRPPNAAKE
jgi:hypothetical protein